MGNHAKRREAAALLAQLGMGRLYRGDRRVAWRMLRGRIDDALRLLPALTPPGLLVADCYGSNFTIEGLAPRRVRDHASAYLEHGRGNCTVVTVQQLAYAEGVASCGCSASPDSLCHTRAGLEAMFLELTDEEVEANGALGTVSRLARGKTLREAVELIRSGGHIHDERGRLLPDWAWYPATRGGERGVDLALDRAARTSAR